MRLLQLVLSKHQALALSSARFTRTKQFDSSIRPIKTLLIFSCYAKLFTACSSENSYSSDIDTANPVDPLNTLIDLALSELLPLQVAIASQMARSVLGDVGIRTRWQRQKGKLIIHRKFENCLIQHKTIRCLIRSF